MSGFDPFSAVTEVELNFAETRFKGAVVTCRLDLTAEEQFALLSDGEGKAKSAEEQFRAIGDRVLKSWNLCDRDGVQIPANGDGMMRIPAALAALIRDNYIPAAWSLAPLSQPSSD